MDGWNYKKNENQLLNKIGKALVRRKQTVATAESCTGGRVAALLTEMSGSSAYFNGAVVAYSNDVKETVLGVSWRLLGVYGAVSEEVVREMAVNARCVMNSDWSVATSGIAGPTGGTREKPIGTVWIAVAAKDIVVAFVRHFDGCREEVMRQASQVALEMLLKMIEKQDEKGN